VNKKATKVEQNPPKRKDWLERRSVEHTQARGTIVITHDNRIFPVYPVNRRLRKIVDQELGR